MRGVFLERLAWPEAADLFAAGWTMLLPVGAAAKEHGPHLPLATDRLVALELARRVAEVLPVAVLPPVDFGYYPAFAAYPGSQHIRAETFIALVGDLLDGLVRQGARRIAILNTGVSTEAPLRLAQRGALERHGLSVHCADLRELGHAARGRLRQRAGGHADEAETAAMLALAPELVRLERARPDYGHAGRAGGVFHAPAVLSADPANPDWSETGATGDPTLATAETGEALLAAMADDLVAGLRAIHPDIDATARPAWLDALR